MVLQGNERGEQKINLNYFLKSLDKVLKNCYNCIRR